MDIKRHTVSVDEAAKILGISRGSAFRAVCRREIPSIKIGGRYLVPVPELERMLGVKVEPPDEPVP